jgi:hypothetical protein
MAAGDVQADALEKVFHYQLARLLLVLLPGMDPLWLRLARSTPSSQW